MTNWRTQVLAPAALAAAALLPGCKNEYYDIEAANLQQSVAQLHTLDEKAQFLADFAEQIVKNVIHDFAKGNDKAPAFEESFKRHDSQSYAFFELLAHTRAHHAGDSAILLRPMNKRLADILRKINDKEDGARYLAEIAYPGEERNMPPDRAKFLGEAAANTIHSMTSQQELKLSQ